mgnify:CR=1 FL=1
MTEHDFTVAAVAWFIGWVVGIIHRTRPDKRGEK